MNDYFFSFQDSPYNSSSVKIIDTVEKELVKYYQMKETQTNQKEAKESKQYHWKPSNRY